MAIPLDTRRLVDANGSWVEEGSVRGLGLPLEWWRMNWLAMEGLRMVGGGGYVNAFAEGDTSIVTWGGLEWDEYGWSLFARAPNDKFPWDASTVVGNRIGDRYRGDGAKAPPFLLWNGFLISWDADRRLHGLYPSR